jgi:DNA (cytosine-5)-methyltransferase 1
MKFLDLFAGIGGIRLGMESAGHECVGYVEIDKFARQSYQAINRTKEEWTAHDIKTVSNESWRQFRGAIDCICGGFPCQSFSIAGKRAGFADKTRGTLFFEIARAAEQIQPRYLFLENVKGLLNHAGGATFRTILSTLDELGYDAEWQLCNSKDFGVPQNRERVIIIGHLRSGRTREVFFDAGEDSETSEATQIIDLSTNHRRGRRGAVLDPRGLSSALTATDYKLPKQILQVGNIMQKDYFGGNPQPGRVYSPAGISPTLNTMTDGGREPKIAIPVSCTDVIHKIQHGRRIKDDLRIRKLTPRECWRLQGFPDGAFDKAKAAGMSDSQLYKQAGNSVTVPLMEFVARRLDNLNCPEW